MEPRSRRYVAGNGRVSTARSNRAKYLTPYTYRFFRLTSAHTSRMKLSIRNLEYALLVSNSEAASYKNVVAPFPNYRMRNYLRAATYHHLHCKSSRSIRMDNHIFEGRARGSAEADGY
jgi:hypothetical protein